MSSTIPLAAAIGFLLQLLFEYVPGFAGWFESKDAVVKRQVMLLLTLLAAIILFVLSCYGPFDWLVCSGDGAWELVVLIFATITANQGLHQLSRKGSA